jgi:hypothetical protein
MNASQHKITRRNFLKSSTKTAASVGLGLNIIGAPVVRSVLGANEKIRIGFIGLGNRGTQLLRFFLARPDIEIAALCFI